MIEKRFRSDLGMWESRHLLFGFIVLYKYALFQERTQTRIFFSKPNATYIDCTPTIKLKITQEEFQKGYDGNKWSLPINYEII